MAKKREFEPLIIDLTEDDQELLTEIVAATAEELTAKYLNEFGERGYKISFKQYKGMSQASIFFRHEPATKGDGCVNGAGPTNSMALAVLYYKCHSLLDWKFDVEDGLAGQEAKLFI